MFAYLAGITLIKKRNTAYISFVKDFRKLVTLPKEIYFWELNGSIYFSFRRHLIARNIRRRVQGVGRNRVCLRVPIPIQLRRKYDLDKFDFVHVEQVLDFVFRCHFETNDENSLIRWTETIRFGRFTNKLPEIKPR